MPERSLMGLVGILQRHGLTFELLELLVHHCETKQNGGITFHTAVGNITSYEVYASGKVAALRQAQAKELTSA